MSVQANVTGRRHPALVPVDNGEIDYRPLFASAKAPGLRWVVIEQDNAGQNGGDALADARANHEGT